MAEKITLTVNELLNHVQEYYEYFPKRGLVVYRKEVPSNYHTVGGENVDVIKSYPVKSPEVRIYCNSLLVTNLIHLLRRGELPIKRCLMTQVIKSPSDLAWDNLKDKYDGRPRLAMSWLTDDPAVRRQDKQHVPLEVTKGVDVSKRSGRFRSFIMIDGTSIYLDVHETREEAARLHDLATLAFAPRQRLNGDLTDYKNCDKEIDAVRRRYENLVRLSNAPPQMRNNKITLPYVPPPRQFWRT